MNTKVAQKTDEAKKMRREIIRDYAIFAIALALAVLLLLIFPERKATATITAWNYFLEMIAIMPAVMIIMGLFNVFVSKEQVVKYLGKTSGIKGILLAIFFGALPTGPLYIAFPLALALWKKGARVSNIVIFLSAWACIKIPQELVELQFLGLKFMAARLTLTVVFVILMGLFIEKLMAHSDQHLKESQEGGKINEGI
jgi:uncharacterized membrane protein YraQ (UPF0718 family)